MSSQRLFQVVRNARIGAVRDQRPLRLCAVLAVAFILTGMGLLVWSYVTFWQTGLWLKSAALTGGAVIATAVATLFFGFMADMATRLRQNQEEILYWLRRR